MDNSDEVLLAVSTRLESIDDSLKSVVTLLQEMRSDMQANIQQLATMSENQLRFTDRVSRDLSGLETLITQQNNVCDKQASHIDRLVGIVERLIDRGAA